MDDVLSAMKSAYVIMDTTYFARSFGLMVWMDNATGCVLAYQIVTYETNAHYRQGIATLQDKGLIIHSITCDGKRGLLGSFAGIPTQMCQFHQIRIITRYLTTRPKHLASIELKLIANTLTKSTRTEFGKALDDWYLRHEAYFNERSVNEMGKSWCTHKRLRSAYKSLRRNLPYLFTYQDDVTDKTPNTTNKLEGLFSSLKQSLGCHQGLSQQRKLRFIDDFMKCHQS